MYCQILSPAFLFLLTLLATPLHAQDSQTKFILDLPIMEAPYGVNNGFFAYRQFSPGMQASMNLAKSVTEAKVYGLKRLIKPEKGASPEAKIGRWAGFAVIHLLSDYVLMYFPLGEAWNHEEWHRAVLTQNKVSSHNDVNDIPFGQELIAVSHLEDAALAAFKKNNNPDYVRLSAAGIEGQIETTKALQKDNFFCRMNLPLSLNYFFSAFSAIEYVRLCAEPGADDLTIKAEEKEVVNVEKRGFVGLDMLSWIYDLPRPDEPYEARGIHPSGTGIRRYRRTSDLTGEELGFLKKMGNLQLVNFISPAMFFVNSIRLHKELRFNFSGFHHLTSFGYDLGGNLFFEYKGHKIFGAIHNYHNLQNSFLGLEMQVIDRPLMIGRIPFFISPSLHLWSQPAGQEFRTSEASVGGRAEAGISIRLGKYFRPYMTLVAITKGWTAGDSYLDEKVFARFGVRACF